MDQPGKVANPARGQLNRENEYSPVPVPAGEFGIIFKMTKEGTFTMISRVVVVRHLGKLLCAVGPMISLFKLSSLHPWGS